MEEAVTASFKVPLQNLPRGRKNHKKCQDSRALGRDSNTM